MVVLEVAVGSWFVEDNEVLVCLKMFPRSFDGDHVWQVFHGMTLELRSKGRKRNIAFVTHYHRVGA